MHSIWIRLQKFNFKSFLIQSSVLGASTSSVNLRHFPISTLIASVIKTSGCSAPVDSILTAHTKQNTKLSQHETWINNQHVHIIEQIKTEYVQMKWSRILFNFTWFFSSSWRNTSLLQLSFLVSATLAIFVPAMRIERLIQTKRTNTFDAHKLGHMTII